MHYFLQHDYEALLSSIEELRKRITDIGKEMGESCREGAETFHDNFAHEDATRQLGMLSLRFRDLSRIKEQATIVSVTADSTTVRIGKRIRV
ncbi:MAG: hypothetical protein RIT04_645, partial [Candidatus Parcubacteria bacterium]